MAKKKSIVSQLSEEAQGQVSSLMDKLGLEESSVVEQAIRTFWRANRAPEAGPVADNTEENPIEEEAPISLEEAPIVDYEGVSGDHEDIGELPSD